MTDANAHVGIQRSPSSGMQLSAVGPERPEQQNWQGKFFAEQMTAMGLALVNKFLPQGTGPTWSNGH
eukprot:5827170-Heterocapsa_arctica.AAC.1